jgi:hypothetical protein
MEKYALLQSEGSVLVDFFSGPKNAQCGAENILPDGSVVVF